LLKEIKPLKEDPGSQSQNYDGAVVAIFRGIENDLKIWGQLDIRKDLDPVKSF